MLTVEQIEKLASRKGVKRIAVENFLMSLDGLTPAEALGNLELDRKLYNWNEATVNAIRLGIQVEQNARSRRSLTTL